MIEILLVDDHKIFRSGLRRLLSDEPNICITDEAASGGEALLKLRQKHFSLVMLDINMTGRSGLEVLESIRRDDPQMPVLFVSMYPEEQFAVAAMNAGANGYVSKDSEPADLIAAIRTVAQRRNYVSPRTASLLQTGIQPSDGPPHYLLSARELQIMTAIVLGQSLTEIGQQMFLSVKTVSTYRTRILQKLNLSSNAELVRYAVQNHLIH